MNTVVKSFIVVLGLVLSSVSHAELVYLAKVNFNGTIFNDILVLESELKDKVKVNGSLSVPGVFTTQFIGRRSYTKSPSIFFKTTAIENGNEITIEGFLEGSSISNKNLTGYLDVYLNEGKEKVRAELNAELIYKDDK